MKKKIIFVSIITVILLFITISTLNKKNDYAEITANAYVSSFGIDYNQDKKLYTVYLYILNNFNISRSEYGTSSPDALGYICKGEGKSISESLANINRFSNIRLQYSHIRSLILKDTFFTKQSIIHLYNQIKLSVDFYPTFNVYTTFDELNDIFNVNNFSETSAYYTILVNNDTINKAKDVTFLNYINDLLIPYYTVAYPILKISNDAFFEKNTPITSIDIIGYGFITDEYSLSTFTFNNLQGLMHLNKLSKNVITYPDFDFLVYEYKLTKKIKKDKLYLYINMVGIFVNKKIINKNYIDELIQSIKYDLTILKETMDNYKIDVFNIDYLTREKNSYSNKKLEIIINIV